jgi:hypothetical protein
MPDYSSIQHRHLLNDEFSNYRTYN